MSDYQLSDLFNGEQADQIVEILKQHRHSMERCEAIKRFLLPLADDWPAGVTVDDVAYKIVSRVEGKSNGSSGLPWK